MKTVQRIRTASVASTSSKPDALREKLRELGDRRQAHEDQDAELATEIRTALREVEELDDPHLSKTEAARLLKMHRTTLYRVYGD